MDTTAPLCEATIPPQADQQDRTQDVPQDLMHDAPHDTPQDAPSTRRNTRAIPIWAPLRNRAQERLERVALDIGGSLVKVVYYTKRRCDGSSADNDTTSGKVRAPSTGPAGRYV